MKMFTTQYHFLLVSITLAICIQVEPLLFLLSQLGGLAEGPSLGGTQLQLHMEFLKRNQIGSNSKQCCLLQLVSKAEDDVHPAILKDLS